MHILCSMSQLVLVCVRAYAVSTLVHLKVDHWYWRVTSCSHCIQVCRSRPCGFLSPNIQVWSIFNMEQYCLEVPVTLSILLNKYQQFEVRVLETKLVKLLQ